MSDQVLARFGKSFEAGDVLFNEGDAGDEMFVIQTGKIRISKRIGQAQRTLAVLGPGDFVGEMSILNNKPRTATATAVETTQTVLISAKTLESMIARNTEIAIRLIRKLAARLDAVGALVDVLMRQDPRARIILGLCHFAETRGQPSEGGATRIAITPQQLATELGVEPLIAEEVVTQLRRLKLVDEDPTGIIIVDPARLGVVLELLEASSTAPGAIG